MTDHSVIILGMVGNAHDKSDRSNRRARREDDILKAALDVFIEEGFSAARIEDVAARAGIAKGTVYLYFESKEVLFRALVRTIAGPPISRIETLIRTYRGSTEDLLRAVLGIVRREILETDRRRVVRLIVTEAHRFPEIADYYYDEVVSRAMRLLSAACERGVARGEFFDETPARFPQLVAAPFLLAVVWEGLFQRRAPLDVEALLEAHVDLLMRGLRGPEPDGPEP